MLAVVVLVGIFLYYLYYNFVGKRKNLPPGPTPLPFLGNLLQVDRTNPEKTFAKFSNRFGGIKTFWAGETPLGTSYMVS